MRTTLSIIKTIHPDSENVAWPPPPPYFTFACFKEWVHLCCTDTNSVTYTLRYQLTGYNLAWTYLQPHYGHWGFRQCLPFKRTTLRGKHCRHPIAVMGVVDTFRPSIIKTIHPDSENVAWPHPPLCFTFACLKEWVQLCCILTGKNLILD